MVDVVSAKSERPPGPDAVHLLAAKQQQVELVPFPGQGAPAVGTIRQGLIDAAPRNVWRVLGDALGE